MTRRLRPAADERGIALIAALGIMVVLSMTTVSVIAFAQSNERHAHRSTHGQVAFSLAEAGVNAASARLATSDDPLAATALDPTVAVTCPDGASTCNDDAYDTGAARWTGTLDLTATPPRWRVTSWGVVTTPTGGEVVRRLVAEIDVVTTSLTSPNAASWNFVYSRKTSDATTCDVDVTGTEVVIDVPVHVAGNLCLTGTNAKIVENTTGNGQPVSVTVVGKLVYAGTNSKVGESAADPITSGAVGVGCATTITGATHPCSPASDRWWIADEGVVTQANAPDADFDAWYHDAKPGPDHDCAASASPPPLAPSVFDNDTTPNRSAATFDLTPSSSYRCRVYEGGDLVGELSWNSSTKKLTLAGVVFIDGDVLFNENAVVEYDGSAVLYLGGKFTVDGANSRLCANATCNFDTWDPNAEMLMVIADGSPVAVEFLGSNNKFQGAIWTNAGADVSFTGTNFEMEGPIVGGGFSWGTRVTMKPLPVITSIPPGAPLTENVHVDPQPPRYVG